MLSAQTYALAEEQARRQIPHFLREIEVASDSGPLWPIRPADEIYKRFGPHTVIL
jgi:hypothetical protein